MTKSRSGPLGPIIQNPRPVSAPLSADSSHRELHPYVVPALRPILGHILDEQERIEREVERAPHITETELVELRTSVVRVFSRIGHGKGEAKLRLKFGNADWKGVKMAFTFVIMCFALWGTCLATLTNPPISTLYFPITVKIDKLAENFSGLGMAENDTLSDYHSDVDVVGDPVDDSVTDDNNGGGGGGGGEMMVPEGSNKKGTARTNVKGGGGGKSKGGMAQSAAAGTGKLAPMDAGRKRKAGSEEKEVKKLRQELLEMKTMISKIQMTQAPPSVPPPPLPPPPAPVPRISKPPNPYWPLNRAAKELERAVPGLIGYQRASVASWARELANKIQGVADNLPTAPRPSSKPSTSGAGVSRTATVGGQIPPSG